ncbi:MAG TPA: hypothetical protein VFZ22_15500 [Pyrinomonadaceae bacterium]|nr:hypothetical protein [Pyrinomonadaceae bacterium]
MTPKLNTWLTALVLILCIAIAGAHLWVILQNAVNVPYWDEWGILSPDALPAGFTFRWIVAEANEHRLVPTKLLAWGLFYISGHNHILSMVITDVIYGLLLACIVFFARRMTPHLPLWVTLAFIIFLLTPINWENNFWGFESSFRFAVLFTLLAVYFLFSEPQTGRRLALGVLMSVLATYSFFAGLVAVCITIVLFALFKIIRALGVSGPQRRAEYVQLIAVVAPVLLFVGLFFIDYHRHAYLPSIAYPHEASFWNFFANLVSWGFGFESHSVMIGALCLLLVLAPIVLEIRKKRLRLSGSSWAVYVFPIAMLGVLGSVAAGRAHLSASAKISRYADFAMMLVPFSVLAWAIFLKDRPGLRRYALIGLWLFCCVGFSYKWLWFPVYKAQHDSRKQGVECIKTYYKQGGVADCPTLYSVPIGSMLDDAKRLNLSFYRDIQKEL